MRFGIDRAELIANGERALTPDESKAIEALAARRLQARAGGAHFRRQGILEPAICW